MEAGWRKAGGRLQARGCDATAARLTPDQKVGSSNLFRAARFVGAPEGRHRAIEQFMFFAAAAFGSGRNSSADFARPCFLNRPRASAASPFVANCCDPAVVYGAWATQKVWRHTMRVFNLVLSHQRSALDLPTRRQTSTPVCPRGQGGGLKIHCRQLRVGSNPTAGRHCAAHRRIRCGRFTMGAGFLSSKLMKTYFTTKFRRPHTGASALCRATPPARQLIVG